MFPFLLILLILRKEKDEFGYKTVIKTQHCDTKNPNPSFGVSKLLWHSSSAFFMTYDKGFENVINVWKVGDPLLHSELTTYTRIVQKDPIFSAQWHPTVPMLAYVSGKQSKLFFWSESHNECTAYELPESLPVVSVRWNKEGTKLIVLGESQMCVAFLEENMLR